MTNNILLYVSTYYNDAACGADDTTGYGFKREEFFILLVTQFMGDMLIKHGHDISELILHMTLHYMVLSLYL